MYSSTRTDSFCPNCYLGIHDECYSFWDGASDFGDCCCGGVLDAFSPTTPDGEDEGGEDSPLDAYFEGFTGSKPLSEYADPISTGRKEAAKKFPIKVGMTCEWAWLAEAGGGVTPIVGCTGRPASDIHHGPDKNTLNNTPGNIHRVCDFCHNTWHARNDAAYGERPKKADGTIDATRPFVPLDSGFKLHNAFDKAPDEKVFDEERRRRADARRHGNL